jgi:hypothetical protein
MVHDGKEGSLGQLPDAGQGLPSGQYCEGLRSGLHMIPMDANGTR